jgi:hypothetical protein
MAAIQGVNAALAIETWRQHFDVRIIANHGVAAVTLFWLSRASVCFYSVILLHYKIQQNCKVQEYKAEQQHNTTQHNTTQHNTTQHNTTQSNKTQHSIEKHKTA